MSAWAPTRVLGLFIGLVGVAGLAWSKAGFTANEHGVSAALAIGACLLATASYGYGGNFTKKYLSGVSPLALATGSQLSAALVLAVPGRAAAPGHRCRARPPGSRSPCWRCCAPAWPTSCTFD